MIMIRVARLGQKQALSRLAVRSYSIKFSENFDGQNPPATKPKLSEFKNPLLHTFLLASATYMALQALWSGLEYEHVEAELLEKSKILELEMQKALDDAHTEMVSSGRHSWVSKLKFWQS